MRSGLITRLVVGGAIVAGIFLAQLWFSFDSLRTIRHDTREEQRASQSIVAATRIEKLVLDLETSTRGYVITRQESFLQPYLNARRELPVVVDAALQARQQHCDTRGVDLRLVALVLPHRYPLP